MDGVRRIHRAKTNLRASPAELERHQPRLDDEDRPVPMDESGHIVLTTLWNPTMPLIRYRSGDVGALA
jgi:phenylacetate-coenzyme A ligase PaaK-like adenylate-forming protein